MSTTTTATTGAGLRPTTKQKVGIVIAGLYSLSNIPSVLVPTPDGETGPPFGILVVGSVVGVIGLAAAIAAWRGSSLALRIAAGAIIVATLTAIPAFFVDVPMAVKALVGAGVLLTGGSVALMFSGRRPSPVVD